MLDFTVCDANLWIAVLGALHAARQHRVLLSVCRALTQPPWAAKVTKELARLPRFVTVVEAALLQPLRELAALTPEQREALLPSQDVTLGAPGRASAVATLLADVVTLAQALPALPTLNLQPLIKVGLGVCIPPSPNTHTYTCVCVCVLGTLPR